MAFLTINGLTISVKDAGATIQRAGFGVLNGRSFSGTAAPERSSLIRSFEVETTMDTMDNQRSLAGLVGGEGHYWAFDADLYSSKGLPPDTGYTITMSATGGQVGGYVQVTSGQTLTYSYATSSDFTMMVWKKEGVNWLHYAYVYDVATTTVIQYKSGAPHTPAGTDNITNWYAFSSGTHTFRGKNIAGTDGNAPYDDLVIVPYAMTPTMVASFYALTNGGVPFSSLPKLTMGGDIIPEVTLEVIGTLPKQPIRTASISGTNLASVLSFTLEATTGIN